MTKKAFGVLFAFGMLIIVIAVLLLVDSRQDRGFLDDKGPTPPVAVGVEPGSEDWQSEVQEGIAWWNQACGLKLMTFAALDGAHTWVRVDTRMAGDDTPGSVENPFTKIRADGRVEIVLPPANAFPFEVRRARIIRHELGHALRLDHDDFLNSVMFPRASASNGATGSYEVTPDDCARLKALFQ